MLRWLSLALAVFVLAFVAADRPLAVAAPSSAAASLPRSGPPVAIKCRVVGLRVTLGLHHHRDLRDGSARSVHEREVGRASLDDDLDDDLDDTSSVTRGSEPIANRGRVARPDAAAGHRRDEPAADPTRFGVGTGLPRGPPA